MWRVILKRFKISISYYILILSIKSRFVALFSLLNFFLSKLCSVCWERKNRRPLAVFRFNFLFL